MEEATSVHQQGFMGSWVLNFYGFRVATSLILIMFALLLRVFIKVILYHFIIFL